jgi:hypothetical protein
MVEEVRHGMKEVHNASKIINLLFDAMSSPEGAAVKDGVTVMLPKQFSVVLTNTGKQIEIAVAPPADILYDGYLINAQGTLGKIVIDREQVVAEIDGLPDQYFRVSS